MNVPFVDLKAQHFPIQEDLKDAMFAVMERGDFALGKAVRLLEEEFASYCGVNYAVGVDSGLSALELCLHAFEIGEGDEAGLRVGCLQIGRRSVRYGLERL